MFFRLQKLFDTIPRYECSERCQAPNAFFSGAPFLFFPKDGKLEVKESESRDIVWNLWTSVNSIEDLKVTINGQELRNTDGFTKDGLVFTLRKQDVELLGKYLKIKASVKINENPSATKWTISVANNKDGEI